MGHTTQSLEKRLSNHLAAAKRSPNRPVCAWINELAEQLKKPKVRALELIEPGANWEDRERWWIAHYRQTGWLTNLTDGGLGWAGHEHSDDERRRIGIAHRGKAISIEQRQKLRAARLGSKISDHTRAKLSVALQGRVISAETRQKISEVKRGKALPALAGIRNHRAVLNEQAVRDIRRGLLDQQSAQSRYGISRSQFYRVKRGEQWRSIA
ncbi:hypothetical protein G4G30_07545 [Stenotrophomonas maltophilia]|nr:hypothetical protein G4G30_07545 [Stenotrophomonas maltophilia]